MTDAVNRFYNSIENAANQSQSSLVELFVYFLTVEASKEVATPKHVKECFVACDLSPPKNIAARLSEGLKTTPRKYIRMNGGYKLERHMRESLSKRFGAQLVFVQTSASLRGLEREVSRRETKEFLKETIDCFEVGANRATVIMAWILALDHLFVYILTHKMTQFNAALAKDREVKINAIVQSDDFIEMKESKFIELCRSAKIISNDVRKILDTSLGLRNSCAHPSRIIVPNMKVIAFVEDLVENIVLKYKV